MLQEYEVIFKTEDENMHMMYLINLLQPYWVLDPKVRRNTEEQQCFPALVSAVKINFSIYTLQLDLMTYLNLHLMLWLSAFSSLF